MSTDANQPTQETRICPVCGERLVYRAHLDTFGKVGRHECDGCGYGKTIS